MNRDSSKVFEDFPPARLYLADLAEVIAAVQAVCDRVKVDAGQFSIDDPAELKELAANYPEGKFPELRVQGFDPYVSIEFRTYKVHVYVSNDSMELLGIAGKVRDVVTRRKKADTTLLEHAATSVPAAMGVWLLLSDSPLVGLILFALSLAAIPVSVRVMMRYRVAVHSIEYEQRTSFWLRKKDDIVLVIVSALLGGFVTYLITKFIK